VKPAHVSLTSGNGYLVIELSGEFDLATVEPVRERFAAIAGTLPGVLIVDLANVTFLDSTALGLFAAMQRTVSERGGLFVLVNVNERVRRPIELTGLDQVITVHWAEDPVRPWAQSAAAHQILAQFDGPLWASTD
jgi:anti-sigma B factor antagonist